MQHKSQINSVSNEAQKGLNLRCSGCDKLKMSENQGILMTLTRLFLCADPRTNASLCEI